MSKLKLHFITSCICFTYVVLCLSLLSEINLVEELNSNQIIGVFLMVVLVNILIYFTNKFFYNKPFLSHFFRIADIFIIVAPLCYYFNLISLSTKDFIIMSLIVISLYILICLINLYKAQYYASFINEKINKRMSKLK